MIKNADGTPYQLTSLRQFDPSNNEFDLFNEWDQEVIGIAGTPVFYYEVMIQANTVDPLYLEDRGKLWSPNPVCLTAFYDPIPSQNYINMFAIDAPDEIMFQFNYRDALQKLGHPPKVGSRIYTPHKRENWEIIQRNDEVYQMWGQLRLQVMCKRFQESLTTHEGAITTAQHQPDYPPETQILGTGR